MSAIFTDTSAIAAILFDEPSSGEVRAILSSYDTVYAANLLESELLSASSRLGVDARNLTTALQQIVWVCPDRPLSRESRRVLGTGTLIRGADLWHIACALYLAEDPREVDFLTLDREQAKAARKTGFKVHPEPPRGAASQLWEEKGEYRAPKRPTKRRPRR